MTCPFACGLLSPSIDTFWEVPSDQMAKEAYFQMVLHDALAPAENRL